MAAPTDNLKIDGSRLWDSIMEMAKIGPGVAGGNNRQTLTDADAEGTITLWNPAAARLFGWPAGQALGRSLDLIVPPRYRDRHWEGYRRVMATGHTRYGDRLLEVPALHREGHRLSIAFTVTLLRRPGADRPHAIAAVVRDETERWQERRRLTEELARLRSGAGPD